MDSTFNDCCNSISKAYIELGHTQCWSFLGTSTRTLSENSSIALITPNPGGSGEGDCNDPVRSFEDGNIYLNQKWRNHNPGESTLQFQIQSLFKQLSKRIPKYNGKYEKLMKESLVGFFVPFRSGKFKKLPKFNESLEFATRLWTDILYNTNLKLIICIEKESFNQIVNIYKNNPAYANNPKNVTYETGWGNVIAEMSDFSKYDKKLKIARLPHLSTYKLFSRDKYIANIEDLLIEITSHFK